MPAKPITDIIKKDGVIGNIGGHVARSLMEHTAKSRLRLFEEYIKGKKVLDVGLGAVSMAHILQQKGYKVSGVDVTNTSLYLDLTPTIYDGVNIPGKDKTYDVGLLICVLHHCTEQLKVLKETMRVCKRVIIIEDTFRNSLEKTLVSARDNVGNFEFYQHEYRSTDGWQKVFKKNGWKVVFKKEWSSMEFYGMYGRQTLFVIEEK